MASKLPGAIFRRRAHPGFEIRDRAALGHRAGLSPGSRAESASIDGAEDPIAPATLQQEDELARSGWERKSSWSGRRDSNPRPRPWQGRALPLSYTRIQIGKADWTACSMLCQMAAGFATEAVASAF